MLSTGAFSGPCHTFESKVFAKIVNGSSSNHLKRVKSVIHRNYAAEVNFCIGILRTLSNYYFLFQSFTRYSDIVIGSHYFFSGEIPTLNPMF